MFNSLNNIENGFKLMKSIVFASLTISFLVIIGSLVFAYKVYTNSQNTAYLIKGNQTIVLEKGTVKENRKAEVSAHLELFLNTFFSYDAESLKDNVERGLHLVDEVGKVMNDKNIESGFYNKIIAANAIMKTSVDSMYIDAKTYPYKARVVATQKINRQSTTEEKWLIFTCDLEDISRSEDNPHGLIIKRFKLERNERKNLETEF